MGCCVTKPVEAPEKSTEAAPSAGAAPSQTTPTPTPAAQAIEAVSAPVVEPPKAEMEATPAVPAPAAPAPAEAPQRLESSGVFLEMQEEGAGGVQGLGWVDERSRKDSCGVTAMEFITEDIVKVTRKEPAIAKEPSEATQTDAKPPATAATPPETDATPPQTDSTPSEAVPKPSEAVPKPSEAEAKPAGSEAKPAESEAAAPEAAKAEQVTGNPQPTADAEPDAPPTPLTEGELSAAAAAPPAEDLVSEDDLAIEMTMQGVTPTKKEPSHPPPLPAGFSPGPPSSGGKPLKSYAEAIGIHKANGAANGHGNGTAANGAANGAHTWDSAKADEVPAALAAALAATNKSVRAAAAGATAGEYELPSVEVAARRSCSQSLSSQSSMPSTPSSGLWVRTKSMPKDFHDDVTDAPYESAGDETVLEEEEDGQAGVPFQPCLVRLNSHKDKGVNYKAALVRAS